MANATIYGRTSTGEYIPVLVASDGTLQTSGSSGGGTTAISGTVPVTVAGTASVAVAGTATALIAGTANVTVAGTANANITGGTVKTTRSATGTKSTVAAGTASGTILASNAARLGMSVYNDSAAILYLDPSGGTASSTSYGAQLAPGALFEMPFGYTGLVTGAWASASGTARVVEYT